MVSLQDFIRSHGGPKVLSLLDGMAKALNPNSTSLEDLESNALEAPSGTPDNLLPADKLCPFLMDVYNPRLRVRCAVLDFVGNYFMLPHLHRVEQRRPCIIFEAHDMIDKHLEILKVFEGDVQDGWQDRLRVLDARLALGLWYALHYADGHGLRAYAQRFVIDFMQSYGVYFREQTREWFENPVKRLAGVGSDRSGPTHARFLVAQTQPELVASAIRVRSWYVLRWGSGQWNIPRAL